MATPSASNPGPRLSAHPWRSLLIILAIQGSLLYFVGFVLQALLKRPFDLSDPKALTVVLAFTFSEILGYLIAPYFLRVPYGRRTFGKYLDDIRLTRFRPFVRLLVLTVSCLLVLILCQGGGSIVYRLVQGQPLTAEFLARVFNFARVLPPQSMLLFAFFYTMLEEVVFRGVLLRMLLKKHPVRRAILYSALAFGLARSTGRLCRTAFDRDAGAGRLGGSLRRVLCLSCHSSRQLDPGHAHPLADQRVPGAADILLVSGVGRDPGPFRDRLRLRSRHRPSHPLGPLFFEEISPWPGTGHPFLRGSMKNSVRSVLLALFISTVLSGAQDLGELKALLLNRTDENHKAVGIVVGLVDASGERYLATGAAVPGAKAGPDADTVFEIGSITKVFTSLVLADMVARGEVKLDDPVAEFLPATVKVPERDGKRITLRDLSNQVSGLPRMPDNLKPADGADPYVDYGPDRLYEFLAKVRTRAGRRREIRILQSRRRPAGPRPGPQGRDGL